MKALFDIASLKAEKEQLLKNIEPILSKAEAIEKVISLYEVNNNDTRCAF